ncbi:MAG TPA: hypothetical protein PLN24_04650 [Victivallales bacterium]|nr:hypothetical protein [Victivallales bacterium]HPO89825.1 hypothetical protein [Victivallales bacterium]
MPSNSLNVNGSFINFNGQTEIPAKLFGVHYFKMSDDEQKKYSIEMVRVITQKVEGNAAIPGKNPEINRNIPYVIDCIFDRYQPALILEHKDWKNKLESIAENFAKQQKSTGFPQIVEFWNEPYLNWASRPGVNYDPFWFEKSNNLIKIKNTGENISILEETQELLPVMQKNNRVHYLAARYVHDYKTKGKYQDIDGKWQTFKYEEGFSFNFRGEKCILKNVLWYKDKTQKSYYSAEFNEYLYSKMFLTFAKKIKEQNPEIKIIGGWDCNIWWDDWTPWKILYKPLIDKANEFIDGLTEHHYGCDTRMIGAEYEIASNYFKTKYNKNLKFYNTEAGGSADPEQPGKFSPDGSNTNPINNFIYTLRDIIHLLCFYPDKAESRAYHMPQNSPGGLDAFLFLKELRGKLLFSECTEKRIWHVASLNEDNILCLVIFNDNSNEKILNINIQAPPNYSISSASIVTYSQKNNNIVFSENQISNTNQKLSHNLTIPKMSAVKYIVKLEKKSENPAKTMYREQFFCNDILSKIHAQQKKSFSIQIPNEKIKSASLAKLRIVHNQLSEEISNITINNKKFYFHTNGEVWTSEFDVPVKILSTNNHISIQNLNKDKEILIASISIILFK